MSETSAKPRSVARRSPSPVPAHANAQAHAKLMGWLKTADRTAVMDLSVKAGVYNRDGSLNQHYKRK